MTAVELELMRGESISALSVEDPARAAAEIRDISLSHKRIWQRLPRLAIEGAGKRGFQRGTAARLAEYGLLEVPNDTGISGGLFGTFIDCESGHILAQSHINQLQLGRLASDRQVIRAWGEDGSAFDAEGVLEYYEQIADAEHYDLSPMSPMQASIWTRNMIEVNGLDGEFYQRA